MQVTFKLKPKRVEARTKSEVINKVLGQSIWSNSNGWRRIGSNYNWPEKRFNWPNKHFNDYGSLFCKDGVFRVYNLQKVRRKTVQKTRTITRGARKGEVVKTVEVIRRGHWVAHYYDIPQGMVERIRQGRRNFEVVFKDVFDYNA